MPWRALNLYAACPRLLPRDRSQFLCCGKPSRSRRSVTVWSQECNVCEQRSKRYTREVISVDAKQIHEFWEWFLNASDGLIDEPDNLAVTKQLDDRLREIHRGLVWEICHGGFRSRQLTISPNLDPQLRHAAREIIHAAPVLAHWEFYATRQPKEWDYKLHLNNHNGQRIELDVCDWVFLLVPCFNGKQAVLLSSMTV